MATAALTNVPTSIADGESITGWSGDTFVLEPDIKVEGSNSVALAQTTNGNNDAIFTKATGSWDFSTEHLRLSWNSSAVPAYADTKANGGVQIGLSDGTNTDWWYVDGSDTYAGGWTQSVFYAGSTPDIDNAADLTAITSVTYRMATTAKPRNVPANLWLDAWYFGDGFTVTGGTSGDEIDWSHIAALDKTSAYGIVTGLDEVYFLAGEVIIGDGISATWFKPEGRKVQFKDLSVNSTLYNITFFDDASALTNINIVSGAWGAAGTQRYIIDASETTINSFSMNGVQISKADVISFHAGADIQSNVFDDCLQITPSTATFQLNTVSGYTGTLAAVLAPSSVTNFKTNIYKNNTDVTNNPAAIEYATVGTYTSDGDTFSGNDFDILNSDNAATITAGSFVIGRGYKILTVGTTDYTLIGSLNNTIGTKFVATGVGAGTGTATELLVLNKANGSNPSTSNDTGTNADELFVGSVPITVTVVDGASVVIEGASVYIKLISGDGGAVVLNAVTNASGIAATSYAGATPVTIDSGISEVRDASGPIPYGNYTLGGDITSAGYTQTAILSED